MIAPPASLFVTSTLLFTLLLLLVVVQHQHQHGGCALAAAAPSNNHKATVESWCVHVREGVCDNATLLAKGGPKVGESCAVMKPWCQQPDSDYDGVFAKVNAIADAAAADHQPKSNNNNQTDDQKGPFEPPAGASAAAACTDNGKGCFAFFFPLPPYCCNRCLRVFQNPITGICG